jgi:hypothetical protein
MINQFQIAPNNGILTFQFCGAKLIRLNKFSIHRFLGQNTTLPKLDTIQLFCMETTKLKLFRAKSSAH